MPTGLTISIIMPVKNGAARIERALDSVAAQDWPYELIVMDGASTDTTLDILSCRKDEIAFMASEPDDSATTAVNRGTAHASGQIIAMLMSDDLLAPGALRAIGEAFTASPDTDVISGGVLLMDERANGHGGVKKIPGPTLTLGLERILATPYPAAYFFKKALWDSLGGLSSDYRYGGDRNLLMQCKLLGARHQSVNVQVYHYSMNEGSDTLVENPSVIRAFLKDHCRMAEAWLKSPALDEAERKQIRRWRRDQVMELATRDVQLGDWRAAVTLLSSESARDPAQIIVGCRWLGAFGWKAVARKLHQA